MIWLPTSQRINVFMFNWRFICSQIYIAIIMNGWITVNWLALFMTQEQDDLFDWKKNILSKICLRNQRSIYCCYISTIRAELWTHSSCRATNQYSPRRTYAPIWVFLSLYSSSFCVIRFCFCYISWREWCGVFFLFFFYIFLINRSLETVQLSVYFEFNWGWPI